MTLPSRPKVALLGNPNSGKSSLFNLLTGLRQDVSNFPGVTVEKKIGIYSFPNGLEIQVTDFPGTYSLYPNSTEEKIVINTITNPNDENYPDLVIYVADATQLERHLLFASQIRDLNIPMIFVLNMTDIAEKEGKSIHLPALEKYLDVPIVCTSVRSAFGVDILMDKVIFLLENKSKPLEKSLYKLNDVETFVASRIMKYLGTDQLYHAKILAHHYQWLTHLHADQKGFIGELIERSGFNNLRLQVQETMRRYDDIVHIAHSTVTSSTKVEKSITDKIDEWVTHRIFGPILFFLIMTMMFQSIFTWATYPMDLIEEGFAWAGKFIGTTLPEVWWSDLIINGLLAGLGGVLVFVPQIFILFFLIAILEESGYMSRVVFMFDAIMQRFGMNGRSMVSLISSGACAIPAIMATRTISNYKERLITILVSPLISCSARLPVYAVLIGFAVPSQRVLGLFNTQGLAFMGLYMMGIVGAFVSALFFKKILKSDQSSFLMIELPNYKTPMWKNIIISVKEKVMSFVVGAGKVIMVISLILWFLASYGPGDAIEKSTIQAEQIALNNKLDDTQKNNLVASYAIQSSYIGKMGKWIEPLISPLGFDWKIGIALLTSFAAREVFVGTMATIYSIGSESDGKTIRQKMAAELRPGSREKVYDTATSVSLLLFYVFAMQCMSTLAVTKKETNSWKWPIIQFLFMGIMAYVTSFIAYQALS
ncbi:MAG: ferrous iron transport protein B [Saprospiraceae bacterium]